MARKSRHIKMLLELKDFYGYQVLSTLMGYKTPNTLRVWEANGSVPQKAQNFFENVYIMYSSDEAKKEYMESKKCK